jgi:hypothetical protein
MTKFGVRNQSLLMRQYLTIHNPPVADVDFVVDDTNISALAVGAVLTLAQAILPHTGRNLTLTVTDAASTTLSVTITAVGKDHFGRSISESITATGAATFTAGAKIFKDVESITITAMANNTTNDKVDVGFGNKLGLLAQVSAESQIDITRQLEDGTSGVTGLATVLAGSSTYVDRTNDALQAVGSGGSGAIATGDQFGIFIRHNHEDPDDRFRA